MKKSEASSIVELSKTMGIESAMNIVDGFVSIKAAEIDFFGKKKMIVFRSDKSALLVNDDGTLSVYKYMPKGRDLPQRKLSAPPGIFVGDFDKERREKKRQEFIEKNHKKNGTQSKTKFRKTYDLNPAKDPSRYALDFVHDKGRAFAALSIMNSNPNNALRSLARMCNSGEVIRHVIGARTYWIFNDSSLMFRDEWTREYKAFSSLEEMDKKMK